VARTDVVPAGRSDEPVSLPEYLGLIACLLWVGGGVQARMMDDQVVPSTNLRLGVALGLIAALIAIVKAVWGLGY
jgi:hypothetical protein